MAILRESGCYQCCPQSVQQSCAAQQQRSLQRTDMRANGVMPLCKLAAGLIHNQRHARFV